MARMARGGRPGIACAVIYATIGRDGIVVTEAEIEAILGEWQVDGRGRGDALTQAYFSQLRKPENDRPHNVRGRELLAGMGADVEAAEAEWRASSYVQGNPWG